MSKLKVLDLFSGIGGFSLGLERTGGFETVAFCEIEEFPRRVLAKHWPKVPIYHDVRELTADTLRRDGIAVDVICGGFPCQDVSLAGKRGGLDASRSGLWTEYHRLVCEIRPLYVIVENTPGLLSLGMDRVLGDLAASGYDVQWDCIPANRVGAPHERDRVWLVAYPNKKISTRLSCRKTQKVTLSGGNCQHLEGTLDANANARKRSLGWTFRRVGRFFQPVPRHGDWTITSEPVLGRGADGIPNRLDRVGALGNAVVPQIPELIGRAILAAREAA